VCHNPHAVKLCGSLHKLCDFHRKKANLNQMRLQQRRRVTRAQMAAQREHHHQHQHQHHQQVRLYNDSPVLDASLALLFSFAEGVKTEPHHEEQAPTFAFDDHALSDHDAQLLQSILFGEPQFSVFGFGSEDHGNSKNDYSQSFDVMELLDIELCL
jgi:hypothetical protein